MTRAAVAGVAAIPVRRKLERSVRDTAAGVAFAAVADAGLDLGEIDGLFASPPALGGIPSFMWSCTLAHHLGLSTRTQTLVECGGLTAAVAFKLAVQEVRSGRLRAALVLATDVRADERADDFEFFIRNMTEQLVGLYGPHDALYGLAAPIPYYAMSAQRYLHEHGLSRADLAPVAVALRDFARDNPRAELRKPITEADVLAAAPICPPLGLLDCSAFASGAAAAVIVSDDLASRRPRVVVRGMGEAHEPAHFAPLRAPLSRFESPRRAAAEAYQEAGIAAHDVDVAEVYGVFTATELMLYESLGFFDEGRAPAAVRDGLTRGEGATVFDPSGGRLSLGHPAGATPLYSLVEIVEQLRGACGPRQVKDAKLGLFHAEHGMLNGSFVGVLEAA